MTLNQSIQLRDGMTAVLQRMDAALNRTITDFERMQAASQRAVPTGQYNDMRAILERLQADIAGAREEMERLGQRTDQTNRRAKALATIFRRIANALGGPEAVNGIIELSDGLTQTVARLNLMNDQLQTTDELQRMIFASAQRSRASYLQTADTVAKLGLRAKDAFKNNQEVIAFAEQLNKKFVIAGASQQEMASASLQLTQALGSGVLRGEEFNAVFEAAPNIMQTVADYMHVPIGALREMAADGEITAEIVKNALLSAAEETNAAFESMPMTFGQLWTSFANQAIMAFDPVLVRLREVADSEDAQAFVGVMIDGLVQLASVAVWVFELLASAAAIIQRDWVWLGPLFLALAVAAGVYAIALGIQALATWAADDATKKFFITLLTNPLFWIALAIGVVVAVIYKWVQSVGGLKVAWLIAMNAIKSACASAAYNITSNFYHVLNMLDRIKFAFAQASVAVANAAGDMKVWVTSHIRDMVNGVIDLLNQFIAQLNKIKGVSIEAVAHVTWWASAEAENEAAKAQRGADLAAYQTELEDAKAAREQLLIDMKAKADAEKADRLAEIELAKTEASEANGRMEVDQSFDWSQYSGLPAPQAGDLSDTAGNTGKMADALDMAEDDLKYLRDLAAREAINRFTTAEIKVDMTNYNNVSGTDDLDGIANHLAGVIEEKMAAAAEGVHV